MVDFFSLHLHSLFLFMPLLLQTRPLQPPSVPQIAALFLMIILLKRFLKQEQLSDSIVVAIYVMEIIFVMFSLT